MNSASAYTPLEALLLFQSLITWGTEPDVFIKTSNLLKNNRLVRETETYDAGRLSPDALRELYLRLLGEELAIESNGEGRPDASPSKKRKLQSPPLQTIKDGKQYVEKLPQLVDRLYARYRNHMIRSIREDEQKWETLQREIDEIERGDWDERILKEDRSRTRRQTSVLGDDSSAKTPISSSPLVPPAAIPGVPGPRPSPVQQHEQTSTLPPPPLITPVQAHSEDVVMGGMSNGEPSASELPAREATLPVATPQPATALPAPVPQRLPGQDAVQVATAVHPSTRPHPGATNLQPDHMPPIVDQRQPVQQYPQPSPYAGPPRAAVPGHTPPLPPAPGYVPSSPLNPSARQIPPPPYAAGGPTSPNLDQLADLAGQQFRAPPASPSIPTGPSPGTPVAQSYPPYPPNFRPPEPRVISSNGAPPQWQPPYPSPYAPAPTFTYSPQPVPNTRPFPVRPEIIQGEQRTYESPYNRSQGRTPSIPAATPFPAHIRDSMSAPHTPASSGLPRLLTGRATRWTPNATASTPKAPLSPRQPAYEPLSPVLLPSISLDAAEPSKLPTETPKPRRGRPPKAKPAETPDTATTLPPPSTKGRRPGRPKASSPPSSTVPQSSRSQSIDELSFHTDAHIGRMSMVKQEESATPKPVSDIDAHPPTTATTTNTTDRRYAHLRSSPIRPTKRKRQDSPLALPSMRSPAVAAPVVPVPTAPPTHVHWTRNFPRISASALEQITTHRYASVFATPVRERDAPGYKAVVYKPQDLKSIRLAVGAGNRAALAVAATLGSAGEVDVAAPSPSAGGGGGSASGTGSVLLPISEDLVPPKGIINNAQLEKELMRMFANAIMFNHDPNRGLPRSFQVQTSIEGGAGGEGAGGLAADERYEVDENGVVREAREMGRDVEKVVEELKGAERRRGDGDGGRDIMDRRSSLADVSLMTPNVAGFVAHSSKGEEDEDEVDQLAGTPSAMDAGMGSVAKRRRRM